MLALAVLLAPRATCAQEAPAPPDLEATSDKLLNPLSDLWSLQFQNNFTFLGGDASDGDRQANVFLFQPVTPVPLGERWNLINRPIFQVVSVESPSFPGPGPVPAWERTSGLGDLRFLQLVAPNRQRGRFFGVGWNAVLPTATADEIGQGTWQLGPAAAVGMVGKRAAGGLLFQHAWSVAGDGDRADVNTSSLQYFLQVRLSRTFNLGLSPQIVADWEADGGERWQVPVGFGFSSLVFVGKLPVKFGAEVQYYVEKPDAFGPQWVFLFNLTPVIPNLLKDIQI